MASFPTRRFAAQLALVLALVTAAQALAERPTQKGKKTGNGGKKVPKIAPAAAPVTVDPKVVERVKPSVAFIDTKSGTGSGFLVLPNVVATNSHVIRDDTMKDVTVRFVDAGKATERLTPRLLYEDKARDLALLLIPAQVGRPVLDFRRAFKPGPNETVFVVGNPGQGAGIVRVNAVGIATADEMVMMENEEYVQLKFKNGDNAIDIGPGTSGGPVLDPSGRVIGVLTAGTVDGKGKPGGLFYGVPATAVSKALAELEQQPNWEKVASAATARHLLGIASINYYLTGKLATAILEARVKGGRQWNAANAQQLQALNDQLTSTYKTYDKELNSLAGPAYREALKEQKWPHDVREDLIAMRDRVGQLRVLVPNWILTNGAFNQCKSLVNQNEKAFRRLQKESGLTDRVIDEMTKNLLDKVNAKIK